MPPARVEARPVERRTAVPGVEAEEAQHAQAIFGDAGVGIADEAHTPRGEIAAAVERIVESTVEIGVERIEGEIAPAGIFQPIVGEGHGGAPSVGLDVTAQRRQFELRALDDRRHRAVLQAGRHALEARCCQGMHDGVGRLVDRHVDVVDLASQHRVAHAAADEAGHDSRPSERVEQRAHSGRGHPDRRIKPSGWLHDAKRPP